MESLRIDAGEVTLHCVAEGSGPPVVLLHGFPEHWYSWRRQLPALAAGGFRALAPDLRGYNESDRPEGVQNYTLKKLATDVSGLCRALGPAKVRLVGHDWGGVIAWAAAHLYPELIERLVILNAPHPSLRWAVLRPRQLARLWYAVFFQLPWLPENRILQPWFLPRALRGLARNKAAFSDGRLQRRGPVPLRRGAAQARRRDRRAQLLPGCPARGLPPPAGPHPRAHHGHLGRARQRARAAPPRRVTESCRRFANRAPGQRRPLGAA
jgi:pimeloyl-ACP methyl ester carboxylesterase